MTVESFVANDLFVARVFKHHQNNPDNVWANSYEFRAVAGGDEGDLLTLANILLLFERNVHLEFVDFDRVTISTWEADSVPYDPAAFISVAVGGSGILGLEDSEALSLNQTLAVARVANFGRFGHLFYRAQLTEAEVVAPAGKTVLQNRATKQGVIDTAITTAELDGYLGTAPTAALGMVMVNADGTQVRAVLGLAVQGVTTLPTDHAWFNRTSP